MPYDPVDPASLEGDALRRWYQRSPAEVEQQRQAIQGQQYNDFFGGPSASGSDDAAGSGDGSGAPSANPGSWADNGSPDQVGAIGSSAGPNGGSIDTSLAGPDDGGELSLIGNPANPRLRQEWVLKFGIPWPKDPVTGRNYDVAHIIAKADGGTDHVDNIRPMHPAEHAAEHMANGDYARWARRAGIARAFGGTVARALGPLDVVSAIASYFANSSDDPIDRTYHMFGVQTAKDRQQALDDEQRAMNPNWKPGDPYFM